MGEAASRADLIGEIRRWHPILSSISLSIVTTVRTLLAFTFSLSVFLLIYFYRVGSVGNVW